MQAIAEAADQLREMADAIASDISRDFPELDTSYNLYVEELPVLSRAGVPESLVRVSNTRITYIAGLIDMGEAYQGTYEWFGDAWAMTGEDPYELEQRILRRRGFRG